MRQAFYIILALLLISIGVNVCQWRNHSMPNVVINRDTVWKDTVIYQPQPTDTIDIGKTVYVKVPVMKYLPGDTVHDSIKVPVPIIQKRYNDSLYTAWVSGFEPNLDSIDLRLPTITETVTKTIVKPSPSPIFGVGIQLGAGIGIVTRQPDFYIGVGCHLNF